MRKHLVNITLAILSGILGFMAFPPFGYAVLAWVCLVPLLIAVRSCTVKEAFLYSYISGVVFFSGLLYWLVNVSVPGTMITVMYIAVYYALFGAAANIVSRRSTDLMALPFVWVVLEYVRGHLFTGFPWGLLGYTQYKTTAVIQIADITGAYGVSFLVAALNAAFYAVVTRSGRKIHYLMTALVFVLIAAMYGTNRLTDQMIWGTPRLSVVQGNIPQDEKWDPASAEDILKVYSELTALAAKEKPDMIIWPESSYPYLVEEGGDAAEEVRFMAAQADIPILIGAVGSDGSRYYNDALLFNERGELAEKYTKMHLVPFGEYVPFEALMPSFRDIIDKPIGNFTRGEKPALMKLRSRRAYAGPGGTLNREILFYKFGVMICFEDVFPYIARESVMDGADFLVNITNDAWFGDTAAPEQHLQASVFRAVENRVPVIRAANTGISCFISASGEILSRVNTGGKDTFVRGIDTQDVKVFRGRAYYTRRGDIFIALSAAILGIFMLIEIFLRKKPS